MEAGGLHILGTERHEARRIDNQLRGRAGRQGDPGSSRFYLSLEDDLLRIFGADRIQGIMDRLGMEEGEPIEHGLVTRAIENAQGRVEARNFDIRKHLLEYDDVMNKQREVIYDQRRTFLTGEDLSAEALEMIEDTAEQSLGVYLSDDLPPEEWDWKALDDALFRQFNFRLSLSEEDKRNADPDDLRQDIHDRVLAIYREREENFTPSVLRYLGEGHSAPDHRRPVERPSAVHGSPQRGRWAQGLRAEKTPFRNTRKKALRCSSSSTTGCGPRWWKNCLPSRSPARKTSRRWKRARPRRAVRSA